MSHWAVRLKGESSTIGWQSMEKMLLVQAQTLLEWGSSSGTFCFHWMQPSLPPHLEFLSWISCFLFIVSYGTIGYSGGSKLHEVWGVALWLVGYLRPMTNCHHYVPLFSKFCLMWLSLDSHILRGHKVCKTRSFLGNVLMGFTGTCSSGSIWRQFMSLLWSFRYSSCARHCRGANS